MNRVISNKYEELEQLGQGGQGVVYKVRHVEHKTILALKVIPSHLLENPELAARFEREVQIMTRLRHRNIVEVLGSGRDTSLNLSYIVMEFIQGNTLRQHLKEKGPLPLLETLEIIRQVAEALNYAHNQPVPIIHRDIKPTNVMIEEGSGRVVLLDFGIAKELGEGDSLKTKTGLMIGTWKYSSPEQLRQLPLTGSADIYSLGMMLYEMHTGAQFFAGLDEYAVLGKVLYDTHENEPVFTRPTPPEFAALVAKAMAKSLDKRYRRMADFLDDLERCWSAIDETRTVMLPEVKRSEPQPAPAPHELDDLEEQIRKLQEERERRMLAVLRKQVQDTREKAERADAPQWAAAFFTQGLAHEQDGEAFFRNAQYVLARRAYEAALTSLTKAHETAAAALLLHKAEQARQAMWGMKADADRYNARERARTFYSRALALQARADEFWVQHQYEQAQPAYMEAYSVFEDARDLAYRHGIKQEAETIQSQTRAIREAALSKGVEQLAVAAWQEATSTEQQAADALAREEFTQARALYQAAMQKYEQAQRQGQMEQRRQALLRVEQRLRAARQQAITAGVQETDVDYQQAVEAHQRAERHAAAQEYTQAEQAYEQARLHYETAVSTRERERRRQAVQQARLYMETARHDAKEAGAEQRFASAWAEALSIGQTAGGHEGSEEHDKALVLYRQAAHRFEQLQQAAHEEQQRETAARIKQAEAARQAEEEQRRQRALNAQQQAEQSKEKAEQTAAQRHAQEVEAAARQKLALGEQLLSRKTWEQAETAFLQAQELFDEAVRRTQRQQAEVAQQQINTLKERLQPLAQWWGPLQARATEQERAALEQWGKEPYGQSAERYAAVLTVYHEALQEAEAARCAYEAATMARQGAEQARQEAAEAQAGQYAATLFNEAHVLNTAGEQQFAAKAWAAAASTFTQARAQFQQSRQQAAEAKEQARQAAEEVRKRAAEERVQIEQVGGQERFRTELAQAQQIIAQGQGCEDRQEFMQALALYEQARQRFIKLRQEAVLLAAREQAETAQRHVTEAKQIPESLRQWLAKSEKWQEAQQLETAAEQAWRRDKYPEAEEQYQQAARLYALARAEADTARQRQQALDAQQQAALEQAAVDKSDAQQYAASLYQQATDNQQRGAQSLKAQHWAQAESAFLQAQQFFAQARESVQRAKARQLAIEAREKALQAQHDAAEGATLFPKETAEASEVFMAANRAFAREDFAAAEKEFAQSTELFQAIQKAVALRRQREQAEQAQNRARELHSKTLATKGRQKRRVERTLAEGESLFQQGRYSEAQVKYEEAASFFAALQLQQREDVVAAPARSRRFSLSLDSAPWKKSHVYVFTSIASLLVILSVLYHLGMLRSSLLRGPEYSGPRPTVSAQSQGVSAQSLAEKDNQPGVVPPTRLEKEEGASKAGASIAQEQDPVPPGEENSREEQARTPPREGDFLPENTATEQRKNPPGAEASQQFAKATPSPPPAPPLREPPLLAQVSPSPEREILIEEGKNLNFTVEAENPQQGPLRYAWFLDGKKQQEGGKKNWTYKPDFDAAGEKPKEVRVEVTNSAKLTTKQIWSVWVQDVDRPPTVIDASPKRTSIEIEPGAMVNFSVQAVDPDKDDRLVYVWSVDGAVQSRGDAKSWSLPASLSEAPRAITVDIIDKSGKSRQVAWSIAPKALALPPRITSATPARNQLVAQAGQALDFSVGATLPGATAGEPKARLRYQWSLNDSLLRTTETGDLHYVESRAGTYQLSVVAVSDDGLKSAPREWTIEIHPLEVAAPPALPQLSEAEIQAWLETYRHAWEGKDVEALVALGVVPRQASADLSKTLAPYKEFRVTLTDINIDRNGPQAKVSFRRIDTVDGRSLPHPDRIAFTIEKRADGQIAIRR